MVEEEVLAPAVSTAAVADLRRKLDDLEPEAVEQAEDQLVTNPNAEADVVKNVDDEAEADGSDAKRPRLDGGNDKPHGLANENGLNEEKLDGVVDAEWRTEDTTKEEEKETVEVKTEQRSSVDEHISVDNQQVYLKEETKEVLVNTEEACTVFKEGTKEFTIQEKETVEPSNDEPQKEVNNFMTDEPSSTDASSMSQKIEVPNNKVGVLIGKAGDTIRYLQYNSGAKIQITKDADADPHSVTRPVEIIGTLSNIEKAKELINAVIAEADAGGSPSLVARGIATAQASGGGEQVEVKVPNEKVGLIIGRGGETIKGLQTRSGARIQLIPQHLPEGDGSKERIVRVTGDMRQIEMAQEMIKEVLSQTVRLSPHSGGFNQQAYQPRGPSGPAQWGPRGSHPTQSMAYNYQQRGHYPSQNPQYLHPTYGNYPSQQTAPRSNFGGPSSMQGFSRGSTDGYDYYSGQGGHVSDRPVSVSHSTPIPAHPLVPSRAPASGPPPPQSNYNYGQQLHGPEYGHQPPYSQTAHSQSYGRGYDDNHAHIQHPYGGVGNSQPAYSQGGLQPGYPQQQPYGMPTQGAQPQSYGTPRPSQPGYMPYQSQAPAAQSYGPNVPHQQHYPYAMSGAMQQTYPSYGSAPATDGYDQPQSASGPSYSQGQAVPSYTQPAGQLTPGYGQVATAAGYAQYANSQQVYSEQPAPNNAGYGYQATQDPNYSSSAPGSAYTAQPSGQPGYAQPTSAQSTYDQSASQSSIYGVAQGNAAAGYGKTVSPQPGYPQ